MTEPLKYIGEDHTGDQHGCARCGAEEHLALVYKPFTHFIDLDDGFVATHWAPCPTNGEPILLCQGSVSGISLISKERLRQSFEEGWTAEHDDTHTHGELAYAAVAYLTSDIVESVDHFWPWDLADFKRSDYLRDLTKAGALIAAEIDRLQRGTDAP